MKKLMLNDIHVGDVLESDSGFTCIPANTRFVVQEDQTGLWIPCECGRHYLDGQTAFDEKDRVVGLSHIRGRHQQIHGPDDGRVMG